MGFWLGVGVVALVAAFAYAMQRYVFNPVNETFEAIAKRPRRRCPHCRSLIDSEATACPRCTRDVEPLTNPEAGKQAAE